jgi:hypothetical protein
MDFYGAIVVLVVLWAWIWPKSAGAWAAEFMDAYDEARLETRLEKALIEDAENDL